MIEFLVEQGMFSKFGDGDMTYCRRFTNYDDALKHFNAVKEDFRHWVISKSRHVLITELTKVNGDVYDLLDHEERDGK